MGDAVKRSYSSPARAAAAEETRERIRLAARDLFVEHGYQGTTLKDVAERAGVGERTLYDSFGNKFGLLRHTVAMLTMGDESRVRAADRDEAIATRALADPREALTMHVRLSTDLMNRAGDMLHAADSVRSDEPEVARLTIRGTEAAYETNLRMAQRLKSRGELIEGLSAAMAADILFTLTSPGVFHTLRRRRGWSQKRYREWVTNSAIQQLLRETEG